MSSASEIMLPREAARYIAEHSVDVSIHTDGVEKTAQLIIDSIKNKKIVFDVKRWATHELNPKQGDKAAVEWIFLSDLLNFSFWSDDESQKFSVKYGSQSWTGYWSLCACINRALDEGIPFTDPKYFSKIELDELRHIFRSDTDTKMPLIEERLQVLHEAGRVLCDNYDASFVNMLNKSEKSAQKLLQLVTSEVPSFNDVTEYKGQKVAIFKRAQILIADIWACCGGSGLGEFNDIDTITMFADYRIPQCLAWFDALEYSNELKKLLQSEHRFKSGDRQEVEIRGCSIHAVELIVDEAKRKIKADSGLDDSTPVNAILIDHFLWDYRREHAKETEHIPIHKIRCIYY